MHQQLRKPLGEKERVLKLSTRHNLPIEGNHETGKTKQKSDSTHSPKRSSPLRNSVTTANDTSSSSRPPTATDDESSDNYVVSSSILRGKAVCLGAPPPSSTSDIKPPSPTRLVHPINAALKRSPQRLINVPKRKTASLVAPAAAAAPVLQPSFESSRSLISPERSVTRQQHNTKQEAPVVKKRIRITSSRALSLATAKVSKLSSESDSSSKGIDYKERIQNLRTDCDRLQNRRTVTSSSSSYPSSKDATADEDTVQSASAPQTVPPVAAISELLDTQAQEIGSLKRNMELILANQKLIMKKLGI